MDLMVLTLFGDWVATRATIRNEYKITVNIFANRFNFKDINIEIFFPDPNILKRSLVQLAKILNCRTLEIQCFLFFVMYK
jgi:hypothetical protein